MFSKTQRAIWFKRARGRVRHCPSCGGQLSFRIRVATDQHLIASKDHILPVQWGGTDWLYGDTVNVRWLCRRCNRQRADVNHCIGALACVHAIADRERLPVRNILKRLQFWKLSDSIVSK